MNKGCMYVYALANDRISVIFNPPSSISLMIIFLAIYHTFQFFTKESFEVGRVVKRCTNLNTASDLITFIIWLQ